MNFDLRQLTAYFNRLAPRERLMLVFALVTLVVLSLYSFVWDPLQTNQEQLLRRIASKEKELTAVQLQRDQFLMLARQMEANQSASSETDPNFNLLAYLQTTITQAVSKERILSMNPSNKSIGEYQEQVVDIKLQQINLQQLTDLLYRVEKGEHPLRFSRLNIKKRFNDIYNFDVAATVSILKSADKLPEKGAERGGDGRGGA